MKFHLQKPPCVCCDKYIAFGLCRQARSVVNLSIDCNISKWMHFAGRCKPVAVKVRLGVSYFSRLGPRRAGGRMYGGRHCFLVGGIHRSRRADDKLRRRRKGSPALRHCLAALFHFSRRTRQPMPMPAAAHRIPGSMAAASGRRSCPKLAMLASEKVA